MDQQRINQWKKAAKAVSKNSKKINKEFQSNTRLIEDQMNILMCKPDHYGIFYEINPWMSLAKPALRELALEQWQGLYQTLTSLQVEVALIAPVAGLPDLVFTANAGLVYKNEVMVAHFYAKERRGESAPFAEWFAKAGYEVTMLATVPAAPFFEGAGDALFLDEQHLVVGYGFRSEKAAYQHPFFQRFQLIQCELVDPYFYHLDTCFCPLTPALALWYPAAFSPAAQKTLQAAVELIAVDPEEAKQFACNAVVVGKHVILPTGSDKLKAMLEARQFIVHSLAMSEFIKAGGACKCLTLRL